MAKLGDYSLPVHDAEPDSSWNEAEWKCEGGSGSKVFLILFKPSRGAEMRKTRPCLVVSPDEMNDHISTVIDAPMMSKGRKYPTRVTCPLRGV